MGKGAIAVDSDGKVEAIVHCTARLSDKVRRAVEDAVASAHPESWKSRYELTRWSGLTDQFIYSFSLKVGEISYPVSWSTESGGLLPDDLRRLTDALWAAHDELAARCQKRPQ